MRALAERSFVKEAEDLRLGAGAVFRGEGILAVTKALLQSGVSYVGGYQGSPISHLMDVLSDSQPILQELGVHFETSASEATAAAMLAASVNYPIRGAVTWKSVVGTNVASDALANIASGGVTGGALVIIGEDYGEGSSIMQERTHAFAMKSQIWLLDPRPELTAIVTAVEKGFELSEASNTPVMLELRVRACHLYGSFTAKDNQCPAFSLQQALAAPRRDTNRIVLPPANFLHEREKISQRWPAAIDFIKQHKLNEFLGGTKGKTGLIVQGGLYNSLMRALALLGLADEYGQTDIPIYCMNVTYPLINDEIKGFCLDKTSVLVVEEGQPAFIEQAVSALLNNDKIGCRVLGKTYLPLAGEYTGQVLKEGVAAFLRASADDIILTPPADNEPFEPGRPVAPVLANIPDRPAGFCVGCPERPIFSAIKLIQKELGELHISCDIGCHLFSILPPFNLGNTTMGYGLGWAGASAFNGIKDRRTISIMGDGGFWHNGLTSGVGNAVFNDSDHVLIVVDNGYSAATGGQDILSSRAMVRGRKTNNPIARAVAGMGVEWIREHYSYDISGLQNILREALTTTFSGPKVIIAQAECMLNKQRRERPLLNERRKRGERTSVRRFGVDADTCTGDHSCIRLSGCPSLTLRDNPDPLRDDPVAYVDQDCVGCGVCGENAHAAILCPSFYSVDIIDNPTLWDRAKDKFRTGLITGLSRLHERRLRRSGAL